jgi:hypothetical protein
MTNNYTPTRTQGVYKTANSTYRVRKVVNGVKISKTFKKFRDAFNFKKTLNGK